jgi:MarR family transcriptional regulator, transcriptional regulator for hemolysin
MKDTAPAHEAKILTDWEGETLSHWVKLAFMTMRRELEASLREFGMTVTQWRALGVLLREPGATHSDLVKHLDIETPSVTSLVDGMERKGWVKRTRSTSDARVKQLSLTPRGRRLIEDAHEAMTLIDARMAATLSSGEQATLKRLLRTMIDGMHSTAHAPS